MSKITKSQIRDFLKAKLASDKAWAIQAMLRIYDRQTSSEQVCHETHELNHVGFTGADARILTSLVEYYQRNHYLSPKQCYILFKKIPKYWNQIWNISDQPRILSMIGD